MLVPGVGSQPASQIIRPIYRHGSLSRIVPDAPTVSIVPRLDRSSGQHIILWSDILRVFKDAQYILQESEAVPFLVDDNFEELKPPRIALNPGVELDVVVQNPGSFQSLEDGQIGLHAPGDRPSPAAPQETPIWEGPAIDAMDSDENRIDVVPIWNDIQSNSLQALPLEMMGGTTVASPSNVNSTHDSVTYGHNNSSSVSLLSVSSSSSSRDSADSFHSAEEDWRVPSRTTSYVEAEQDILLSSSLILTAVSISSSGTLVTSFDTNANISHLAPRNYSSPLLPAENVSPKALTDNSVLPVPTESTVAELSIGTIHVSSTDPTVPDNICESPSSSRSSSYDNSTISNNISSGVPRTTPRTSWVKNRIFPRRNERRGPQADVDPLNLALAPKDVQGRVLGYMEHLQSLKWHEAPMPRLFIVLPENFSNESQLGSFPTGFRLFWMCEYSCDHLDGVGSHSSHHESSTDQGQIHYGFELSRPEEFFSKYGAHLLLNLELFMYSRRSTLAGNETHGPRGRGSTIGYDQGIEFLQTALQTQREQVEHRLDWMNSYLLSLTMDSIMENQMLYPEDGTTGKPERLTQEDLNQLRTFLVPPINSSGPYEHLYRTVDEDGYVQWVCSAHFHDLHPFFFPDYIQGAVGNCGGFNYIQNTEEAYGAYDAQLGLINVRPRTSAEALNLYSTLVAGIGGVRDLVIRFNWEVTVKDIIYLRDASLCFQLVSLVLAGTGLQTVSAAHAELMVEILTQHQLQLFTMEHAQGILKHIHPLMLTRPFLGLRMIQLFLVTTARDFEDMTLDDIGSGLTWIIANSPNIKALKIFWPQLEEFYNVEVFLKNVTSSVSQSIEVELSIRGQEISLNIEDDRLRKVKLKTLDISIACTNPLVANGQVEELAITKPSDVLGHSNRAMLGWILSLNTELHSLTVDCSAEDFRDAELMIRDKVQGLLPHCALRHLLLVDSTQPDRRGIKFTFVFDGELESVLPPIILEEMV
ncbi:hypothetical protein EDD21DRAFT_12465 [Dissophora ornata]|nr:hypothetical protein EDD21DRAFT_12465 [Dissophora ornata]